MWNASDLRRTKRDHFDGKTKIYAEVLLQCIKRMHKASLKGKSNYTFKVPTFIVGLPLYNYDTCLVYVIKELREKDYYVRFHAPSWLYISWDENPEENPILLLQDETNRTNTLLNKGNTDYFQIQDKPQILSLTSSTPALPTLPVLPTLPTLPTLPPVPTLPTLTTLPAQISYPTNNSCNLSNAKNEYCGMNNTSCSINKTPKSLSKQPDLISKSNISVIHSNEKNMNILSKINAIR